MPVVVEQLMRPAAMAQRGALAHALNSTLPVRDIWTANQSAVSHRLCKMGFDGIITGDPHRARRVMEEQ